MQQYNINYPINAEYLEENYIVSKCNENVYNLISNWPDHWGVAPYPKVLLIIGPKSSGKTHLANIWSKKAEAKFLINNESINSIFSNLIIEDIENYDEVVLFHIFNQMHESGKYLLMTASKMPDFSLKDLRSRINSINIANFSSLDTDMIKILLMKYFSDRSIKISVEVLDYLSTRLNRDFAYIQEFAPKLDQFAISTKRKITIPLIKEMLDIIATE